MTKEQFSELLALGTGTPIEYDERETFIDAFKCQVEKTPDATAVVDEFSSITYGELDRRSDTLAEVLLAEGVMSGDFVAVKLPRVKEFLVAVIGIWKAGGAYLPLDPTYPEERIRYMLDDSGARIVIDQEWIQRTYAQGEQRCSGGIYYAKPDGTAILMYTSGSTGKPKGVMIPHRSITILSHNYAYFYQNTAGYKVSELASFSYIVSCSDLYPALISGCELHIIPTYIALDLSLFDQYLRERDVRMITVIPQMAVALMSHYHTPLDFIGIGGARMEMPEHGDIRVVTAYGLTETCSTVIYVDISDKYSCNKQLLGKPAPGSVIVLEDEEGQPVPAGETGEICISSPQLSSGYLHNDELTAEVFVDRPWSEHKVFRTGDLGCWNEDGVLEFHGRKDEMVKVRGNRVELGEVEVALMKVEGIRAAAAAMKEINGESLLCGYYVADGPMTDSALRLALRTFLLPYMIPSLFVRMEALPKLPNGKLDRLSLPVPTRDEKEEIVAPQTEFEKKVYELVSQEIGCADFGVTTNLIALGLTSLRAIRLTARLHAQFGLTIPQSQILTHPTIREWEALSHTETETIAIGAKQDCYPLSDNQLGVFVGCQSSLSSCQYNLPFVLRFKGGSVEQLEEALRGLMHLFPVLKTHLEEREGNIVQVRQDEAQIPIAVEHIDFEPDEDFFGKQILPFNLLGNDLVRFQIYVSPESVWLFFDVHHIIFDGSSCDVLLRALSALYQGHAAQEEAVTSYDYALFLQQWKQGEEYKEAQRYFETLLDGVETFRYPASAGGIAGGTLEQVSITLSRQDIRTCCGANSITENSFFATVLTQVFHRLTREEHIQLAMFSSGRSMAQLSDSVGMFVQTLPLVSHATNTTIADALKVMQAQIIGTLAHDKYPYMRLSESFGVKPDVMYVYQGDLIDHYSFGETEVSFTRLPVDAPVSPLTVEILPEQNEYIIQFEYDSGLYSE